MTNSEEKPFFMHKNPPSKHQNIRGDDIDDHDEEVWGKGCDWFSLFCLKWLPNGVDETDILLHQGGGEHNNTESWWKIKLMKLKQVSEKLAGPKWKNFIRKISGYCNKRKAQKNRFQYDPYSYALNFDNGGTADKEGENLLRDFSSRFAAPFAEERQRSGSGM